MRKEETRKEEEATEEGGRKGRDGRREDGGWRSYRNSRDRQRERVSGGEKEGVLSDSEHTVDESF